MINDISTAVRSKACGLLGGLRNVSEKYLFQAFSKEILGRGGKLKLSRTKSNDMSAAGDFDLSQVCIIIVILLFLFVLVDYCFINVYLFLIITIL